MREPATTPRLFKRLLPVLILAVAVLITFTLIKTRQSPAAQEPSTKRWNVTAIALEATRASPELILYGQFEPPQTTHLSSALSADVSQILASEGDTLSKGSLLLKLDDREVSLQLRQRRADLAAVNARINAENIRYQHDRTSLKLEQDVQALNQDRVARSESLQQRNLLSQEQLDSNRQTLRQQALAIEARRQAIADHPNRLAQLEAERERLQSQIELTELDLERTRILAPFNASILSIETAVGNRVRPGDRLISLYDVDRLQLRAQVPDHWREQLSQALVQDSLKAQAELNGQTVQLELQRLAARINPGQAGVDALFSLPESSLPPLPGQTLSIRLQLPEQDNLFALPPEALYGTDRVYRLAADDRLESVPVELTGQRRLAAGQQQVLISANALKTGDRIITTQLPNAIGGLPVKVVD